MTDEEAMEQQQTLTVHGTVLYYTILKKKKTNKEWEESDAYKINEG